MPTTTEALAKARGWPSRAAPTRSRGLELGGRRPRWRFPRGGALRRAHVDGDVCARDRQVRVFERKKAELDAQVPSINMSALVDWTGSARSALYHVFAEHPSQILRGGAVATIPDGGATRTLGGGLGM